MDGLMDGSGVFQTIFASRVSSDSLIFTEDRKLHIMFTIIYLFICLSAPSFFFIANFSTVLIGQKFANNAVTM